MRRAIQTDSYGPLAAQLLGKARAESRPRTLAIAAPDPEALPLLAAMTDLNLSRNRRVRMPQDAEALQAGLWLLFDYMTQSHDLSQKIATPSGSYWHGILHRREPDAANAKYWFQRVGEHPICAELLADALEIAEGAAGMVGPAAGTGETPVTPASAVRDPTSALAEQLRAMKAWDAGWFVDRCAGAADPGTAAVLLEIQRREWALLFDYNFKKAFA